MVATMTAEVFIHAGGAEGAGGLTVVGPRSRFQEKVLIEHIRGSKVYVSRE